MGKKIKSVQYHSISWMLAWAVTRNPHWRNMSRSNSSFHRLNWLWIQVSHTNRMKNSPFALIEIFCPWVKGRELIRHSDEHFLLYSSLVLRKKSSPINDHSHDIPTKNPSENPHSLEDYAKTNNAKQYTAGDGSVLTENDKLPWPIPYENAEKEFKWKTIQPETKSHQRTSDKLKQIVDLNANNWELASETTSFVPTISTNIQPLFTTALPSYHPYEFESIHAWSNIQPNADEHISENLTLQHDDFYARPIERQNETQTEFTNADHSTIPVERINKEWVRNLCCVNISKTINSVINRFITEYFGTPHWNGYQQRYQLV